MALINAAIERHWSQAVALFAAAAIGLAIGLAATSSGPPLFQKAVQLLLAGSLVALLVGVTWKRPDLGAVSLVVALPLQQVLLGWLFRLGVNASALSVARFWKELVILVLIVRVLRNKVGDADVLDRLALAFVAVTALYVVLPIGPPMYVRTIAARSEAAFLALFLVVRHMDWPEGTYARFERATYFMACMLASFAAWNSFAPESFGRWMDGTGLHQYRRAVLGVFEQPTVFYAGDPRAPFVRAGSLVLAPNVLAFFMLIPLSLVLGRLVARKARWWHLTIGAVSCATVALTSTRSALLAVPLMFLLAIAAGYSSGRVAFALVVGLIFMWPLASALDLGPRIGSGFDPGEASTRHHIDRLRESKDVISARPFGSGLGTSGGTSRRFAVVSGLTSESWYFQVGTELGVFPMLLYVIVVLAALRDLWRRSRSRDGPNVAALCALAGVAASGVVLPNLDEPAVAWALWILVGLALRPDSDPVEEHPLAVTGSGMNVASRR